MSDPDGQTEGTRRRLPWIIGGALALVAIIAVVLALAFGQGGGSADPSASPSATTAPSADSSASPSPAESGAASPSPEPSASTPVPFDGSGELRPGVVVTMTAIDSVEGEAQGPGEVAGPALRVSLDLTSADSDVDLSTVVVNLYYGEDSVPATTLSGPDVAAFSGTLAAGATASGAFVFAVPAASRDLVRVEVVLSADDTVVTFEGAAPSA